MPVTPSRDDDGEKNQLPAYEIYGYYGNPNMNEFLDLRFTGTPLDMCYHLWGVEDKIGGHIFLPPATRQNMINRGYKTFSDFKKAVLKGKDIPLAKSLAIEFKYGFTTQWYGDPVGKWSFKLWSDWWEPWITGSLIGYSCTTEYIVWQYLIANFGEEYAGEALKSSREWFGSYAPLESYKQLDPEIYDTPIKYRAVCYRSDYEMDSAYGWIYPIVVTIKEPTWVCYVEDDKSHLLISFNRRFALELDDYKSPSGQVVEGWLTRHKIEIGKLKGGRNFYLIFPAEFVKHLYRDTYPIVNKNQSKPRTLYMWSTAFHFATCYFTGGEAATYWIPLGSVNEHERYWYYYNKVKNTLKNNTYSAISAIHPGITYDQCIAQLAEQNVCLDMFMETLNEFGKWRQGKTDIPPEMPEHLTAFPFSKIAQKLGLIDFQYRVPSPVDIIWNMFLKGEKPSNITGKEFANRFARTLFDWFVNASRRICALTPYYKEYWLDWFAHCDNLFSQDELKRFESAHDFLQWNMIPPVYATSTIVTTTTTATISNTTTISYQHTVTVTSLSVTTAYQTMETVNLTQWGILGVALAVVLFILYKTKSFWLKTNDEVSNLLAETLPASRPHKRKKKSRNSPVSKNDCEKGGCDNATCPLLEYFNAKKTIEEKKQLIESFEGRYGKISAKSEG